MNGTGKGSRAVSSVLCFFNSTASHKGLIIDGLYTILKDLVKLCLESISKAKSDSSIFPSQSYFEKFLSTTFLSSPAARMHKRRHSQRLPLVVNAASGMPNNLNTAHTAGSFQSRSGDQGLKSIDDVLY